MASTRRGTARRRGGNVRRSRGNVRGQAPPQGTPIQVAPSVELRHIRFMRRHANMAIAIALQSTEAIGLENILEAGANEVRLDAATLDDDRLDAPKRFQPLRSIRAFVDQMRSAYQALFNPDEAVSDVVATEESLDRTNAQRWAANTLTQIAQDPEIPTAVGPAVVATKPQPTTRTKRSWIRENVRWVALGVGVILTRIGGKVVGRSKGIPDEFYDRIEADLTRGARNLARAKDDEERRTAIRQTREVLATEPGIVRRRARSVGRDQTEKLNGRFTEERDIKVGVLQYRWNTQKDNKVRDEHEEREGETFSWNKPPPDGHPGEPAQCRCWASGDFRTAFQTGTLVARSQPPTPLRPGRVQSPRPTELSEAVDPGQIAFQREVFEAPVDPVQLEREERDRLSRTLRRRPAASFRRIGPLGPRVPARLPTN